MNAFALLGAWLLVSLALGCAWSLVARAARREREEGRADVRARAHERLARGEAVPWD